MFAVDVVMRINQNKNWVMMKDEFCAQKVHTQVGLLNKHTVVCCLVQRNYCG
jgi:hypothetical protein